MTFEPLTDILLAAILFTLLRRNPLAAASEAVPVPIAQEAVTEVQPNADVIEVVEDVDGEWKTVSTHHGGMANPLNHAPVGAALRDPRLGVKWRHGHVERGCE
jgi:hypothetical protein